MRNNINHTLFFSQPPQEVWEYLTRPELIELWLMKNDFQPVVGRQFCFRAGPMPHLDFDGIVYCTVLEIVEFKKLSYSWKSGPGDGRITLDSVVVWTLTEKDNGTELRLEHSGFKETDHFTLYSVLDAGWLKNMHKISELLNTAENGTTTA